MTEADAQAADLPGLLVVASTYPRWAGDPEPGFVHALSQRLTSDFKVTVLCPHAPGAATREQLDGVQVIRYRYAPEAMEQLVNGGGITSNLRRRPWTLVLVPTFLLAQWWAMRRELQRHRHKVLHVHWIIPQGLASALLPKRLRPPMLVTSHGGDLFSLRGPLFQAMKRFALARAQAASVVSHAMVAPFRTLAVDLPLAVSPMGVDLQHRFIPSSMERARDELLFVGRLVEKKGLTYLIDALPAVLARHPRVSLTVIGHGPELPALEAQVAALGLQQHVRFVGPVSQNALPAYYQRATTLVAPFIEARNGDQEGLGLVTVEALGCGCPVVTTDVPAVRDAFPAGPPRYLATQRSSDALANVLIELLDAREEAQAWAHAQRPALIARFDHVQVAADYAKQLRAIMEPPDVR
ncbi:glycosyltransferase [Stenotrophomonas maltophilia]|uniref:glycosyltransferase n=3 Tax=Stenotrophomonas maltophilia TaxID=40324 RepID=UPI0012AF9641|nr:glycosyltransferase [Stenotrophomonas maltophilia]QGL77463.1 glycosyltransferase family 4 protein [Stenotrophomonas maltophilia]